MTALPAPVLRGLTAAEAERLLREAGPNELPTEKHKSLLQIAWNVVREPMLLLLLGCATVYLLLGDAKEAAVLAAFVLVVIGITLRQEQKTEHALDALRDLSSPRAVVIRDGERIRIPSRELVPGDMVVLGEGDRIPADGVLISSTALAADESLLTGESVAVTKLAGTPGVEVMARPGGDELPFVYSGTLVVRGHGLARVLATGVRTEVGRIGTALATLSHEPTLLQKDCTRIVRFLASGATVLCAILVVIYGLTRGDWLHGVLAGLTLAMSILPEELPMILTIFLALGAWRLSKIGVLARNMPAIETLGAASVLCVDKTGTVTQNRMSVHTLVVGGDFLDVSESASDPPIPEEFHTLAEFALLAIRPESVDPVDQGVRSFAEGALRGSEHLHGDWTRVHEYPLSPGLLAMSQVWSAPEGEARVVAAKGAPEAILDLCHLPDAAVEEALMRTHRLAEQGLRVLGVARAYFSAQLPENQHDFPFEFLGLVAFADPIRPSVPAAMRECDAAGIRVVMITGDYPVTARSIAAQSGMVQSTVVTGAELDALDEGSLAGTLARASVIARAMPEHKLRLVNALKGMGNVVAMTGDGVNDAPALKSSHIGIAMGQRGTDVAREAAGLVLLNDDFESLVHSVRMGRRLFDNLKKAVTYTFAIHVPIAGLSFLPVVFGWPLILLPVHIAFLELIIDPACSLVFEAEPEERNVMNRPPRGLSERLFSRETVLLSILQGSGVLALLCAVFVIALRLGHTASDARALTFTSLVLANLALIHANRSWSLNALELLRSPNAAAGWIAASAAVFLAAALFVPALRDLFEFSRLHPDDLALCLSSGLACVGWFEVLKRFVRTPAPKEPL